MTVDPVSKSSRNFSDRCRVATNQELAKKFQILSAPSFLVYRGGGEVERFVGDRVNYEEMFGYFQK